MVSSWSTKLSYFCWIYCSCLGQRFIVHAGQHRTTYWIHFIGHIVHKIRTLNSTTHCHLIFLRPSVLPFLPMERPSLDPVSSTREWGYIWCLRWYSGIGRRRRLHSLWTTMNITTELRVAFHNLSHHLIWLKLQGHKKLSFASPKLNIILLEVHRSLELE